MDPLSAGILAGANGVSSIASSLLGYKSQKETNAQNFGIAQYQNIYNAQMYEKQKADALAQWNRENEYNSPEATMERMVKAGINPRAQSLGNFANAGSINQPSMPAAAQYDYKSPLAAFQNMTSVTSNIMDILQSAANIEKTKSETDKNNMQGEMFSSQSLLMALQHLRESSQYDFWKHQYGYHFDDKGNARFGTDMQHKKTYAASVDDIISSVLYNSSRANYQNALSNQLTEDVGAGIQGLDGIVGNIVKPVFRWGSRLINYLNE